MKILHQWVAVQLQTIPNLFGEILFSSGSQTAVLWTQRHKMEIHLCKKSRLGQRPHYENTTQTDLWTIRKFGPIQLIITTPPKGHIEDRAYKKFKKKSHPSKLLVRKTSQLKIARGIHGGYFKSNGKWIANQNFV